MALQGWALAGIVLIVIYTSVPADINFVAANSNDPEFSIPAHVGGWLKMRLAKEDALWVLNDHPFQSYALGTYLQIPFDQILDNRLDARFIHTRLAAAQSVYIVGLYHSKDALSVEQRALLADLENGRILSQHFLVDSTPVWIVGKNELARLP